MRKMRDGSSLVERTYSTEETVEICKIPRSTLMRYKADKKIPCKKVGRDLRYPASWIETWRIPKDHIKLSKYATKHNVSRQTIHAWIKEGRVIAKQSFTGMWWVEDDLDSK